MKRQAIDWEKYLQYIYLKKVLSRIYKNSSSITKGQKSNKNGQKNLNRNFTKEANNVYGQ